MKLIKIKLLCDSRGCKIKYNRCLFVNAFIKRLKTGNTWVNLQNEFKISKTHLHRIFTYWSDNNVFKNVYNTFLKNIEPWKDKVTVIVRPINYGTRLFKKI
jgi:hypothetical protein